ncbi:MAG TPA: hypothetical protein VM532_04805 [Burkholderiales bacterium]|jgi:hypothetical protein|nr:hypothetical protein [Burkholderiales bacterium]
MAKNNVSFGFGVTGTDNVSLRKVLRGFLRANGFSYVSPSFFWIDDLSPDKIYSTVQGFNDAVKSSGLKASLRFISVNAFRDFSMNIHFGKMK